MPIGVNLLPWRAERDRRARRRVWVAMPAAVAIGLCVMLVATLVFREMRSEMLDANAHLRQQIAALADQRAATDQLEQTHAVLSRRMMAMEALLAGRTRALTELAGVVEALPEAVRLIRVERGAERMVIEGIAPHPASISALVNALRDSAQFPDLRFERLGTQATEGRGGDRFRISVRDAVGPTAADQPGRGVVQ